MSDIQFKNIDDSTLDTLARQHVVALDAVRNGGGEAERSALRHTGRELVKHAAASALPAEPPPGLLMSMALRFDHGLGCPGYYDHEVLGGEPGDHAKRLEATLSTMRQLYEEVAGQGFYRPEKEGEYRQLSTAASHG